MVDHPLRTRVKICCITNPEALALFRDRPELQS